MFLVTSFYKLGREEWEEIHGVATTEAIAYREADNTRKAVMKVLRTEPPVKGIKDIQYLPKGIDEELLERYKAWYIPYKRALAFKKCVVEPIKKLGDVRRGKFYKRSN